MNDQITPEALSMTQPKTIRQWLEEIPIPEIRDRAIMLASEYPKTLGLEKMSECEAIEFGFIWTRCLNWGHKYWSNLCDHLESGGTWQDAPMPPGVVNPLRNETKP